MGLDKNGGYLRVWLKGFIEQHGAWICAKTVELDQHHNSRSRTYDCDTT
jgi:hypothetical protein